MVLQFVVMVIYGLIYPFVGKERKQLFLNINRIFKLPAHTPEAKRFGAQIIRSQISCLLESLIYLFFPSLLCLEGVEELKHKVAPYVSDPKKGIIFITGHLGAWELTGHLSSILSPRPSYVLAKPLRFFLLTRLSEWVRERLGVRMLLATDPQILRKMMGVLKEGCALGFVMDQKPQRRQGPVVQFFGEPTPFVSGPAKLALKLRQPVMSIYVIRKGCLKYQACGTVLFSGEPREEDEVALTQHLARDLEYWIRLYPEQWAWNYKRWV